MSLWRSSQASALKSEQRQLRRAEHGGYLSAAMLKQRATDASRKVLAGKLLGETADCAAYVMGALLASMPAPNGRRRDAESRRNPNLSAYHRALAAEQRERAGAVLTVRADDPRYSFTACVNVARHFRRDLLLRIEREAAQTHDELDALRRIDRASGMSMVKHVDMDARAEREATAPDALARELADAGSWQLSKVPDSAVDGRAYVNVWTALYVESRGAPRPVAAHDLGLEQSAMRKREERGRAALRTRHPRARDLLVALLGREPDNDAKPALIGFTRGLVAWRARDGRISLDPAPIKLRKVRAVKTHRVTAWPIVGPPITVRAPIIPRGAMTAEDRAAALTRLARAQYRAMQSTLPTKALPTKSGHAGQTGIKS